MQSIAGLTVCPDVLALCSCLCGVGDVEAHVQQILNPMGLHRLFHDPNQWSISCTPLQVGKDKVPGTMVTSHALHHPDCTAQRSSGRGISELNVEADIIQHLHLPTRSYLFNV